MSIRGIIIFSAISLLAAAGLYVFGMHTVNQLQEKLNEGQKQLQTEKALSAALGQAVTSNEATISAMQSELKAATDAAIEMDKRDEKTARADEDWQKKNEELSDDQQNQSWTGSAVPDDVVRMLDSARASYRDAGRDPLSPAASGAAASLPNT
jgi:hypothetical protein